MSAPKKFRGYAFTVEDWLAICEMHNHRCASCGEEKPLTVDHIKPRAAGGTDDLGNIQPLCKKCNSKKSARLPGAPPSPPPPNRIDKTEQILLRVYPQFKDEAKALADLMGKNVTEMFEAAFAVYQKSPEVKKRQREIAEAQAKEK